MQRKLEITFLTSTADFVQLFLILNVLFYFRLFEPYGRNRIAASPKFLSVEMSFSYRRQTGEQQLSLIKPSLLQPNTWAVSLLTYAHDVEQLTCSLSKQKPCWWGDFNKQISDIDILKFHYSK